MRADSDLLLSAPFAQTAGVLLPSEDRECLWTHRPYPFEWQLICLIENAEPLQKDLPTLLGQMLVGRNAETLPGVNEIGLSPFSRR